MIPGKMRNLPVSSASQELGEIFSWPQIWRLLCLRTCEQDSRIS